MRIRGSGGGKSSSGGSVGPNTLQSDSYARWISLVCEGPIQGFGPNPESQPLGGVYFNNVLVLTNPLELDDQNLTWNYRLKDFEYRYGEPSQTVMSGFTDNEAVQTVGTQVYNTTPVVATTSGPGVDAVRVTIGLGSLIYTDPTTGDVSGTSVNMQIWIQPLGGSWILAASDVISGQVSGPYMCDYQFDLPNPELQYNIKVMRLTPDSTQPTLQNTTYFSYFTEIQYVKQEYPNSVLAGFYINSEYFGSSMPSVGFLVNGMLVQVPSNYYPNLTVTGMTSANPGTVTIPNHGIPLGTSNFQMAFYGPSNWSTYLNGVTFDLCSVVDANTISLGLDATNAPAYPTGVNGNAVAYAPSIWSGTFKTIWTSSPPWCLYDILTNNRYGLGLPASQVDQWGLYTIGQYCDGVVPDGYGGYEIRYSLNCVIQKRDNAYKVLALMASNFQGSVYNSSSGVGFIQDCYRAPSQYAMNLAPANVIAGQFTYSGSAFSDRHTVCLVHWNNPDMLYKKDIEIVEDAAGILQYGWNQVEITAFGCTSRGQAHRKGAMLLDTEQHSTEIVTYRGGYEHTMIVPGDIVTVSDPTYAGARFGGRIVSFDDNGTEYLVQLDAPVTLESGVTYTFGCMVANTAGTGYSTLSSTVTSGPGTATTIVVAYNSWPSCPLPGTIWTLADASGNGIAPRPFVVVGKKEVGQITFEITGVLYDPTKYARVEQNLALATPTYTSTYSAVNTLPMPSNFAVVATAALDSGGILKQKTCLSWECVGITGTSTTSLTIAIGSQSFTANTGLGWASGQRLRAMSSAAPTTNWMEGTITSYNPLTGALVLTVDTIVGSGTIASWNLAQQSAQVSYYHVWVQDVLKGTTTDMGTCVDDFMNISQLKPGQYLFTVEAFTSGGVGSQKGYYDYTVTNTVVSTVALGTNVTSSTGAVLSDGEVITSQGTAAAIVNQGALATQNTVDTGQIAAGVITTSEIAVNAVTNPNHAYGASYSGSGIIESLTATFTVGTNVLIVASCGSMTSATAGTALSSLLLKDVTLGVDYAVSCNKGSLGAEPATDADFVQPTAVTVAQLQRGSTNIGPQIVANFDGNGNGTGFTFVFLDSPGAGTFTYNLSALLNATFTGISLQAVELLR